MKYIRLLIISLSLVTLFGFANVSADSPSVAYAPVNKVATFVGDACGGLSNISSTTCPGGSDTIKNIAKTVVNIMSLIVGILAVIMIIVSGFKYITSGGDSNAVASAKNTLVYAIVGVFIAVIAQFIVHEVLNTSSKIQSTSFLNNNTSIRKDG
ncbi:MAG: pilin [Candidatus Saccharibacteria bacterium]